MHLEAPDPIEIAAWLQLTQAQGISPAQLRAALTRWGPPQQVLAVPSRELASVLGHEVALSLHRAPDPVLSQSIDAVVTWSEKAGHHFITLGDERYPAQLLQLTDPPPVLYVEGDPSGLGAPLLALLLSRNATREGLLNARQFADALAERGIALLCEYGENSNEAERATWTRASVAVAARAPGLHSIRPEDTPLSRPRQTLVFDMWSSSGSVRTSARQADRLMAGLARAVLVIEAGRGSKPLATAQLAAESGRDIFAVPGSIHSPVSKGCHRLIKDGAKLVESAQDILDELNGFKALRSDLTVRR